MAKKKQPPVTPMTIEQLTFSVMELTRLVEHQSRQINRMAKTHCQMMDLFDDLSEKVIDLIEGHNTGFKAIEELIEGHNRTFERVQALSQEVSSSVLIFSTVMRANGNSDLLDRVVAHELDSRVRVDVAPEGSTIIPMTRPIQA